MLFPKNILKKITTRPHLSILILVLLLVSGLLGKELAWAWTEPGFAPPAGNVDAPVNVGTTAQSKAGRLSVTEFYDSTDPSYYINPDGQTVFAGPIGIGTTAPQQSLSVNAVNGVGFYNEGTYNMGLGIYFNTANNITSLAFRDISQTNTNYQTIFAEADSWYFKYGGNANTGLRITNTGDVGIGTNGPTAKLDILGDGIKIINDNASSYGGGLKFRNAGHAHYTVGSKGSNFVIAETSNEGDSIWQATPQERFLIDTSGQVGIGTIAPGAKLDVQASASPALRIHDSGAAGTIEFKRTSDGWNPATIHQSYPGSYGGDIEFKLHPYDNILSTVPSTQVIFKGTGQVGIGDTSPDGDLKLDVEGKIGATEYCDANGANCVLAGTGGGSGDNLGNHTATIDLNMSSKKITNVATPIAASDAATKAYVDAAGAFPDYYVKSGSYNGENADSACVAGYHMCFIGEWIGRRVNTTYNCDGCWESETWYDTNTNSSLRDYGDCSNWTSDGYSVYGQIVRQAPGSGEAVGHIGGWRVSGSVSCQQAKNVMCCSD